MPDLPVEPAGSGRYPADMEPRVALLEQTARATVASLERIERRVDAVAAEQQKMFRTLMAEYRADFRWLVGVMLAGFGTMLAAFGGLLGVIAHGFHWL